MIFLRRGYGSFTMKIYLAGTPGNRKRVDRLWLKLHHRRLFSYWDIYSPAAWQHYVREAFALIKEHNERILLRSGKEGTETD